MNVINPYRYSSGGTAPANTVSPVISGSTTVGSVLTTTDGTWTGAAPITYTYQWKRGGIAIAGATNNTYTTVNTDIGENITCEVTATNFFGSASATSNAIVVSGVLISTMKHEWYFNNVQNASANIITIPDTGTVGGLDISNPALANKPTQSSIGTKISWAADGVDDYLYKATTNFMRSMPTWMVTVVFKYDSSQNNLFLAAWNGANIVNEGISFFYNTTYNTLHTQSFANNGAAYNYLSNTQLLVNGQNYIVTFGWNGTDVVFYLETTSISSVTAANPILITSSTNNISTTSRIRTSNPNGSLYFNGNIGYIGVDEFDLTRLNANVATLKSTFGI